MQNGYLQIYLPLSGAFLAWTARNEAFHQMRSVGSELGLSPSSRAEISGGGANRDEIAEKYFA